MGLLTTYTDANKSIKSFLAVKYTVTYDTKGFYRVTRNATKNYSYIGMTRSAAESCQAAKMLQYTRAVCKEDTANGTSGVPAVVQETESCATVTASRDHDGSWRCDISVSETDILCSATVPADNIGLFYDYVSSRSYDETFDGAPVIIGCNNVIIDGLTYTAIRLDNVLYRGFAITEFTAEVKYTADGTWRYATLDYDKSEYNRLILDGTATNGWIYRVIVRGRCSNAEEFPTRS